MTSERATSYGRVMKTLDDMGAAKLHDLERQRVRNAADTLLFATAQDESALEALTDIELLVRHLAETGRWIGERAVQLADDVAGCGPSIADLLVEQAA